MGRKFLNRSNIEAVLIKRQPVELKIMELNGIDKFEVELELTKWNWVELELELTKWNWPHVWSRIGVEQMNIEMYRSTMLLVAVCACVILARCRTNQILCKFSYIRNTVINNSVSDPNPSKINRPYIGIFSCNEISCNNSDNKLSTDDMYLIYSR